MLPCTLVLALKMPVLSGKTSLHVLPRGSVLMLLQSSLLILLSICLSIHVLLRSIRSHVPVSINTHGDFSACLSALLYNMTSDLSTMHIFKNLTCIMYCPYSCVHNLVKCKSLLDLLAWIFLAILHTTPIYSKVLKYFA